MSQPEQECCTTERNLKSPEHVAHWKEGLWKGPGKFQRARTLRDCQDMNMSVNLNPLKSY